MPETEGSEPTDALNAKQRRFVEEYLVDLSAAKAALRAGYSRRRAKETGYDLLGHPGIIAAIAQAQAARSARTEITADQVLRELAKIGFANMADYLRSTPDGDPVLDFSQLTRDQAAALAEVTVEDFTEGRGEDAREVRRVRFKLADKRAALVDIGKHLGMFVVRHGDPEGKPLGIRPGPRNRACHGRDLAEPSGDDRARIADRGGTVMRQPTPVEVFTAWHRSVVNGLELPRHEGEPQPGWYRLQRVKKGPWIPLLIHLRQVVDQDTGELLEPETLVAELDGEPVSAAELGRLWLWARPITPSEFDALRRTRAALPDMAATHVALTADALALGPAPRR